MNWRIIQNEQQSESNKKILIKKMKTIESIGTFNQTPVNFDQSIVCKRDVFVNNPFTLDDKEKDAMSVSGISKLSRIQSEVNDISKMKLLFQSRMHNNKLNRNHNKSVQRSFDKSPHAKSIEKHCLKPTNTPTFNKFDIKRVSASQINREMDRTQNDKESLKPSVNEQSSSQVSQKNQIVERQHFLPPSDKKKNQRQFTQMSSKFDKYQFDDYFHQPSEEIGNQNEHFEMYTQVSCHTTPKKITFNEKNTNQKPALQQFNIPISIKQSAKLQRVHKCSCQEQLTKFMEQTNNKMAEITQRLMHLQNQNARLKVFEQKFIQDQKDLQDYREKLKNMEDQCSNLKQSNFSYQAEKEELQTLLKQILFKRQKQKYHKNSQFSSKENTYRNQSQNQVSQKSEKQPSTKQPQSYLSQQTEQDFSDHFQSDKSEIIFRKQNPIKKGIEPLGSKSINTSLRQNTRNIDKQKPSDSKMKVQNLLSKLQIKIEKN